MLLGEHILRRALRHRKPPASDQPITTRREVQIVGYTEDATPSSRFRRTNRPKIAAWWPMSGGRRVHRGASPALLGEGPFVTTRWNSPPDKPVTGRSAGTAVSVRSRARLMAARSRYIRLQPPEVGVRFMATISRTVNSKGGVESSAPPPTTARPPGALAAPADGLQQHLTPVGVHPPASVRSSVVFPAPLGWSARRTPTLRHRNQPADDHANR